MKKVIDARLVGPTLIATFRNSDPNLIWRFDLERNHSFTLTLEGDEGDFELGVTSPKGDFYPIARFVARDDADQAFAAVQQALLKRKYGWLRCLLKLLAVLVLAGLMAILMTGYVVSRHGMEAVLGHASSSAPEIPSGVPLPADQVLRPPS